MYVAFDTDRRWRPPLSILVDRRHVAATRLSVHFLTSLPSPPERQTALDSSAHSSIA